MCEFCTQHGEGKQWYMQMKNYSSELLNASLTRERKEATGFDTRREWNEEFFRWFTMPAYTGIYPDSAYSKPVVAEVRRILLS